MPPLTPENSKPLPAHSYPALALGVYGEELALGARVAIFGSAALGLAESLVARGARLVHVYDVDATRVSEANARGRDRSIFYARLPDNGDLGVRDGAFDLVIVPDLSTFEDTAAVLAMARRVVSAAGAALIASPNPDATAPLVILPDSPHALGYYELYEAVVAHFAAVRMIGQVPFVGYAVAEFSTEDPEPTIDTSLAEAQGKEPDWFVALASERHVRLEPFALIELPIDLGVGEIDAEDVPASSDAPYSGSNVSASVHPVAPETRGSGTVLVNVLEAERDAAFESLRQQEQLVREERFRADQANQELSSRQEEVVLLRERCQTLQRALEVEEARRSQLQLEVEDEKGRHHPELATLRDQVQTLQTAGREFQLERARAEQREREREALWANERTENHARVEKTERERAANERTERERAANERTERVRAANEQELERVRQQERALADERDREQTRERELETIRLEGQLGDRGRELQAIRVELDQRGWLVRELLSAPLGGSPEPVGTNGHTDAVVDISVNLDRLAREAAVREADLVAAKWKIAQLERELTQQR